MDFLRANPTIRLGDTLTADQRASITAPILWYENRTIDGRNILTPQLILPPGDLERYGRRGDGLVASNTDLQITGGEVVNTGSIAAGGNLSIEALSFTNIQRTVAYDLTDRRGNYIRGTHLQDGGEISGQNVAITSLTDITSVGGRISAVEDVRLSALGNVSLVAQVVEEHSRIKGKGVTTTTDTIRNISAEVTAGDTLTIESLAGDIALQAARLSGGTVNLDAAGVLHMLAGQDVTSITRSGKKSGVLVDKYYDNGRYNEDLVYTLINSGAGGLSVSAAGVSIDYEAARTTTTGTGKKQQSSTLVHSVDGNSSPAAILTSLAAIAGLGWMAEISQSDSFAVSYNGITTDHRSWNNDRRMLSPAASALIAIVTNVLMPGFGSGILGAAMTAFASSVVSGTIVQGINASMGNAFDFGSVLRNAAVAGLTAGVLNGVNSAVLAPMGVVPFDRTLDFGTNLTNGLIRTVVNSPIQAGINSLITGADFGQALLNSLRSGFVSNVFQPISFNAVGDFGLTNGLDAGTLPMVLLHAAVGATGGYILGGEQGAIGGALGAGLGEALLPLTQYLSTDAQRSIAQIIGGFGSLVVMDASMAGSTSAGNGYDYNQAAHRLRAAQNILAWVGAWLAGRPPPPDTMETQQPGMGHNGGPPLDDNTGDQTPGPQPPPLDPRHAAALTAAALLGYSEITGRTTSDGRLIFGDGAGNFLAVDPVTTAMPGSVIQVDSNGLAMEGGWTATRTLNSPENALDHWQKHGSEFPQYSNAEQYVRAAQEFVTNPPAGTLTRTRANGDILFFDPATETFAISNAAGVPRTMYIPSPQSATNPRGYRTDLYSSPRDYFNRQR